MAREDERPMCLCRVDIPPSMQADVDAWMPKHFDDSLYHPAVTAAASYHVVHDWDRLPAVFNNQCTRFIPYVAESLQGLIDWVDSPQLREAIEDGREREGAYPALEDEPFNGSILDVVEVRGEVGREFVGTGPVIAERFHVGDEYADEFDKWLNGKYLDRAAAWPDVIRARTFRASEGIPRRWPYVRYQGKGNRMLLAEFEEGTDIRAVASGEVVRDGLAESTGWDLRLPYVRRDVGESLLVRYKGDIGT